MPKGLGWQDSNLRNARIKIWCLTDLATAQYIKSGVGNRTRTGDIQNHNLALYQLNYTHHIINRRYHSLSICRVTRLERLELPTHCLEGSCSIQLSYRRIEKRVMGIEPTQSAWKAEILAIELHPQTI